MKVKLTYFKAWNGHGGLGGKYYSEGEYESQREHIWHVVEDVRVMIDERTLPGLTPGYSEYHVLITTEPETVPHLIVHSSFINPKAGK